MGFQIEDGKGRGNVLSINPTNRADVSARENSRSYYVSRDDGEVFNIVSHDQTSISGDFTLYFQNTNSSKKFYVDLLTVGGAATSLWKIWHVTGIAAGSSTLSATILNKTFSNTVDATIRGDGAITGLTTDGEVGILRVPANSDNSIIFDDTLILGNNDAIAVEYDAGTGGVTEVSLRGYFEVDGV